MGNQEKSFFTTTIKHLFCLIIFFVATTITNATIYYVSNNGNNDNSGLSIGKPLKTIQFAMEKVRPSDTVLIRGYPHCDFNYRELVKIKQNNITISGYENEYVLICGLDIVSGDWEKYKNFYRTKHEETVTQLFADGKMMHKARFPNKKNDDMLYFKDWADVYLDSDLQTRNGTKQGWVIFNKNFNWSKNYWIGATYVGQGGDRTAANMGIVVSSGSNRLDCEEVTFRWGQIESDHANCTRYEGAGYIIDHLNALDSEKEWHWQNGWLYFYPPKDKDPENLVIEARTRLLGMNVDNRTSVIIEKINFKAASLTMVEAKNCVLTDGSVRYVTPFERVPQKAGRFGDAGFYNDWGAVPFEEGKSGIYVSGDSNVIKNMYIAHSWFNGILMDGKNHLIENCLVEDIGWIGLKVGAIMAYGDNITVRGNTTAYSGMFGIFGGNHSANFPPQKYARNLLVENNHMHHACMITADAGAFYVNHQHNQEPANSVIRYNLIHDLASVSPRNSTMGIYTDNGSKGYKIHNNIVFNRGIFWSGIFLNGGDLTEVYNNTVWGPSVHGSILVGGRYTPENIKIKNNLCSDIIKTQPKVVNNKIIISNNLINASEQDFVSVEKGNFHLTESSSAIDKAVKLPGINDNYIGRAPDIGACEFGTECFIAGATISKPEFIDEK
jgi:hypothetical protein